MSAKEMQKIYALYHNNIEYIQYTLKIGVSVTPENALCMLYRNQNDAIQKVCDICSKSQKKDMHKHVNYQNLTFFASNFKPSDEPFIP